jgi:RNA recognition motif-containing protein
MANKTPEQDLINQFMEHLKNHESDEFKVSKVINKNCKSKTYADIEFISASNLHWVIEAKSDNSKDRHNTVHKIFGELLKETGRDNRNNCRYAILIPSDSIQFYSQAFRSINRNKFIDFGHLIPVDYVFTSDEKAINQVPWEQFYDVNQA